jgi:flagellar motor switch protein FliM
MAISNSIWLEKLSGQIGHELVFKQYGDKTIISKYPDMSKRKLSKKQLRNLDIMAEANSKARSIMTNEKLKREAQVRLNVTRNKLYHALIREYFEAVKKQETVTGQEVRGRKNL